MQEIKKQLNNTFKYFRFGLLVINGELYLLNHQKYLQEAVIPKGVMMLYKKWYQLVVTYNDMASNTEVFVNSAMKYFSDISGLSNSVTCQALAKL